MVHTRRSGSEGHGDPHKAWTIRRQLVQRCFSISQSSIFGCRHESAQAHRPTERVPDLDPRGGVEVPSVAYDKMSGKGGCDGGGVVRDACNGRGVGREAGGGDFKCKEWCEEEEVALAREDLVEDASSNCCTTESPSRGVTSTSTTEGSNSNASKTSLVVSIGRDVSVMPSICTLGGGPSAVSNN